MGFSYNLDKKVVILPFYGEFGWLVMRHMRYAFAAKSPHKVICCERGQECLFPNADEHFVDWTHPQDDSQRMGDTGYGWEGCRDSDAKLRERLSVLYPDHDIIRPAYDCPWHTSDSIKFRPTAKQELPVVDVCLGVRKRAFVPAKNWGHWGMVASALRNAGLSVGLVGGGDTSETGIKADAYAWEHPDGATAGTLDLLNHCRFFLGTDTGVSHLAALCDIPTLAFRREWPGNDDLTGVMQRANQCYFRKLGNESWDNPDEVLGATLRCFDEASFYSQDGEDRWILGNIPLPKHGTFVEIGAGDGRSCSNSLAFELRGWNGVIVEPNPNRNLSWRKCGVQRCAAAYVEGEADFGIDPWPDLSGLLRQGGTRVKVPCKRLDTILRESGITSIDVLSIDTEGTELDVWGSFDPDVYKPKVVCVEWHTPGQPDREEVITRVISKDGYELKKKIAGNLIFVRTLP